MTSWLQPLIKGEAAAEAVLARVATKAMMADFMLAVSFLDSGFNLSSPSRTEWLMLYLSCIVGSMEPIPNESVSCRVCNLGDLDRDLQMCRCFFPYLDNASKD